MITLCYLFLFKILHSSITYHLCMIYLRIFFNVIDVTIQYKIIIYDSKINLIIQNLNFGFILTFF